jgi:hypothetical protein
VERRALLHAASAYTARGIFIDVMGEKEQRLVFCTETTQA